MKLTYTDLKNSYLRGVGLAGSIDANVLAEFNLSVMTASDLIMAELENWLVVTQLTATTVSGQQFYHMPISAMDMVNCLVKIGSINYPLKVVDSQMQWDYVNQVLIAVTAIPQLFFPRKDDFGIWPIPQSAQTLTLNYTQRSPIILNTEDYISGTVTVTQGSPTITLSGGTFTNSMVGMYFQASGNNDAAFYRISAVTSSTLTLETAYEGTSIAGITYRVGQCPEMPDEGHILLSWYACAAYYGGLRKDIVKAEWWENKFWTGDGGNSKRDEMDFKGGLLGLKRRYAERSNSAVIDRRGINSGWNSRQWGYQISGS